MLLVHHDLIICIFIMARQRIEFIFRLIKFIIKFNIFNLIRDITWEL